MTKNGINLQDSFLNQVRKDNADVTLVLLDGSSLNGHVRGFDNFTVILQKGSDQHLIYKHAIAQVVHQRSGRDYSHERPPREEQREGSHERPQHEQREGGKDREHRAENRGENRGEHREGGHNPQGQNRRPQQQQQPQKSEKTPEKKPFNTLDLSDVKIDTPTPSS